MRQMLVYLKIFERYIDGEGDFIWLLGDDDLLLPDAILGYMIYWKSIPM